MNKSTKKNYNKNTQRKAEKTMRVRKTRGIVNVQDILDIISSMPKTYTPNDVIVVVDTKKGKMKMSASNAGFASYVAKIVFDTYDVYPSKTTLSNAINYLLATRFDNSSDNVHYRIKSDNTQSIYDLNNNQMECVRVTADGWEVRQEDNFDLIPSQFAVEQCAPKEGNIDILKKYVNLSDDDLLLFETTLISYFKADIQHPIINFIGEKGTCKSTLSEILKRLVDPSQQNLGEFSNKEADFKLRLSSEYLVVADNLRKIPPKTSDLLCRAVTGGNITRRKLYCDTDQIMDRYIANIVLTSIEPIVKQSDLIDRTLFLRPLTVTPDKRIPIEHFWAEFEKDKPYILGAIFTILSKAIRICNDIELDNHIRMADFHKFGYAIATVMGKGERFNRLLIKNRQNYQLSEYEGNSLITLILELLNNSDNGEWQGRTDKLRHELTYLVEDDDSGDFSDIYVPDNPVSLGKRLSYCDEKGHFIAFGIEMQRYSDRENYSCVKFKKKPNTDDIKIGNCEAKRTPIFRLPIINGEGCLNKK